MRDLDFSSLERSLELIKPKEWIINTKSPKQKDESALIGEIVDIDLKEYDTRKTGDANYRIVWYSPTKILSKTSKDNYSE